MLLADLAGLLALKYSERLIDMLKKSIIVTATLMSVLLAGCGTDQRYKREINGNDDYLNSPELRKLVAPTGVVLPLESGDYYVYTSAAEGELGHKVDIRAPSQPIATVHDSSAMYGKGIAMLDAPASIPLWSQVNSILQSKNIPMVSNQDSTIQTGAYFFVRADEDVPYEVSYLIRYSQSGVRQYFSVELTSLKYSGQAVNNSIDTQRYTVDFFNMIMLELKQRELSSNSVSSLDAK